MAQKVLIIEDSAAFSGILQKMLLDTNAVLSDIAESHAEAEGLLQSHANQYFAAIVDLNLPDAAHGEATDLCVRYKIPALVFTSSTDQALKEDLWERGIADYAHKSGAFSLEYVMWAIGRLRKNSDVEVLVVDDSLVARKS
jgi:two-component system sensor histidine kinase/response regulator